MIPFDVTKAVAVPLLRRVLEDSPRCRLAVALAPIMRPMLGLYPRLGSMARPELPFALVSFFRAFETSKEISTVSPDFVF
jgi:hypothetical protein